jgi:hypothetical protein
VMIVRQGSEGGISLHRQSVTDAPR